MQGCSNEAILWHLGGILKVALITPYYRQQTRGNAVTVRRIERNLVAAGCRAAVYSLEEWSADGLRHGLEAFSPDCIHAFHAMQAGIPARQIAMELGIPYVVTFTGTDLYFAEDASAASIPAVLSGAAGLVVFHENLRHRLLRLLPHPALPVTVIPQGVTLPDSIPAETEGYFVFLLPAGLRPVKDVLSPLRPLQALYERYPGIRFHIAGPMLDSEYGAQVLRTLAEYPFARWLGEIPCDGMPALYGSSHVVLNSSLSEGGMANSLLEAMAAGRPVLASDIEGNRSLVHDGVNGLLYAGEEDFLERAELLLSDKALRQRLGAAGRQYVSEHCSPVAEAQGYLELYRHVVG